MIGLMFLKLFKRAFSHSLLDSIYPWYLIDNGKGMPLSADT